MNKMTQRIAIGLALLFGANTAMAECGSIQIADMNWPTASLMAEVDRFILEQGYGCEVEVVAGSTVPTFTSMNEKGKPDLAPEQWTNSVGAPLKKAMAEGRLHALNTAPITGLGEGWWIPPATAKKHPELKTVQDVLKRPDLFPYAEDKSKGAFVTCPAGWGCQLVNANLFRAFEMEKKGWVLVDPGSAAGLDGSMTKAVERGENWFGYYWSPTTLLAKHGMVGLDFGVPFVGRKAWDECIALSEQECADPQQSAWTESEVFTVASADFTKRAGDDGVDYIKARVYPADVMNSMLVYMADNQAEPADAAMEFLRAHGDVWKSWVSAGVAAKITNAIN